MPCVGLASGLGDGIISGRVDGYGYRSSGSTTLAVGARNRISGSGGRADRNAGIAASVAPAVATGLGSRKGCAFAAAKNGASADTDMVGTAV